MNLIMTVCETGLLAFEDALPGTTWRSPSLDLVLTVVPLTKTSAPVSIEIAALCEIVSMKVPKLVLTVDQPRDGWLWTTGSVATVDSNESVPERNYVPMAQR